MEAGDTFLIPDLDDHLWAVISEPARDPAHVLLVCFLSWRPHHDQACVLHAGDHPFVKHDTCVNYPGARVVPAHKIEALIAAGRVQFKARLSAEVLGRIRRAAEDADIPTGCYDLLRRQGFVP